jgi:hypothetical protein
MLKELVQQEVKKLVNRTKVQISDIKRIALRQAWKILDDNITDVVIFLQDFATDLSKPEKKDQAMLIMSEFYDNVFTIVEFPFVPKILQPLTQKFVKQILLDFFVSSAIDSTVTTLKRTGVIKDIPTVSSDAEFIVSEDVSPKVSEK